MFERRAAPAFAAGKSRRRAILLAEKSLRRAGANSHYIAPAASAKVGKTAMIEKAAVYPESTAYPQGARLLKDHNLPLRRRAPRLLVCRQPPISRQNAASRTYFSTQTRRAAMLRASLSLRHFSQNSASLPHSCARCVFRLRRKTPAAASPPPCPPLRFAQGVRITFYRT